MVILKIIKMKNLNRVKSSGIIILGICTLIFSSCSSSPESLEAIPKETNIVSVIDIYSIIQKGKLQEITELKSFTKFKRVIKEESKKLSKIINNVTEDPAMSGVNFKSDMFAYYINEGEDERFMCFSIELRDKEKFAEFLDDALEELDDQLGISCDIEKYKNYNEASIGDQIIIGWDEDKAILLIAENYESRKSLDSEIEILMDLQEEDQITANAEFSKFYEGKKDLSVWFSTNLFEDDYSFREIQKEIDYDLADNYISSYLNFGDDNISLLTQITPNSEIQELMNENDVWDNSFNGQLLNYFPKTSYATAGISIDPMSYYNIIKQDDNFSQMQSELETEWELDLKDLFESINGNAVYSIFGFEDIEYTYMEFGPFFNEDIASELSQKYAINLSGYISPEDRELLNQGFAVKSTEYGYHISIKNMLDSGGTVESAIANNSLITWYSGGIDYGYVDETTIEELLPLMGFAFDINGNKMIKKLIDKIPEDEITDHNGYYEFSFDNRYPAYFAFNESVCFLTNDRKSIKSFKKGGYSSDNLASSDISSDILKSDMYTFLNLSYNEYPNEIKKNIKGDLPYSESKIFDILTDFSKSFELKLADKYSVEMVLNTADNGSNSLSSIITMIDKSYKHFLSM